MSVRFGSALADIEEAGKCLALERSTAAVFHLGRTLEVAMRSVAAVLSVSIPSDRQWQTFLDAINTAVAALPTSTEAERHRKSELAQAASNLYNVKLAWRNGVMHPSAFIRHLAKIA